MRGGKWRWELTASRKVSTGQSDPALHSGKRIGRETGGWHHAVEVPEKPKSRAPRIPRPTQPRIKGKNANPPVAKLVS